MIRLRSLLILGLLAPTPGYGQSKPSAMLQTGAEQISLYLPAIKGKRVGMVVNQTSIIGKAKTHLVDSLLVLGIPIKTIFAPEHGFRGQASAGDKIDNGLDARTGIAIRSLYGKNLKPTPAQLKRMRKKYLLYS